MEPLSEPDWQLLDEAKRTAYRFSDRRLMGENISTVGASVRTGDGQVYSAPNMYHSEIDPHYFCAEPLALSAAYNDGRMEVETVVAYRYWKDEDERVLAPCERCSSLLRLYGDPWVIIEEHGRLGKVRLSALG